MPIHLLSTDGGSAKAPTCAANSVIVGLVNNMPDAALRSTERQFIGLLDAASGDIDVRLRLFFLPEVPRSDTARELFLSAYDSIDDLWSSDIDGLIVTGTEPRSPELTEEPYWQSLTRLIDWAQEHTISAIWSCLAAHAAVLHLDGINRRPLNGKLSGVFECAKALDHELVVDAPPSWRVPHSRYNGLPHDELAAHNYHLLTSSPVAGVDSFAKNCNSLFLFFQGHLEYDSNSLLREYVRDIIRFIDGQQPLYPTLPLGYLDPESERAFAEVKETVLAQQNAKPLVATAASIAEQRLLNDWRPPATAIYKKWLSIVRREKRNPFRSLAQSRSRSAADGSLRTT